MNQVLYQGTKGPNLSTEPPVGPQVMIDHTGSDRRSEPGNGHLASTPPLPADFATLGKLLVEALQGSSQTTYAVAADRPYNRNAVPLGSIVITGTGLGLPGAEKAVMDPITSSVS
jgi:hypothetical protein